MEKTINKNVDLTLFGQLKAIDFEYLVQLNGLIGDYTDEFGADVLDSELVTFDITLNSVVKERIEELLNAEARVKEIIEESREEEHNVKYVNEAKKYLESLEDTLDGKTVDAECLEIIGRLRKLVYDFGSLETQISVLKTLIETDIYKDDVTVERAKLASYLAMWEVIREVEQEELDKNREYINSTEIEETEEEIKEIIDGYELNANWDWCGWYISNKLGLKHIDELFLVEYIENEKMHFVIQDGQDFDLCEPYLLG